MDLIRLESCWNLNGNRFWVCFSLLNVSFFFRTYNCFNSLCLSSMISEKVYYFSLFSWALVYYFFSAPSSVLTERFWLEDSYLFLCGPPDENKKKLSFFLEKKDWEPLKELWEPYSRRFRPKTSLRIDQRLCCWCVCVRARESNMAGYTHNQRWVFRFRRAQIQYEK